MVAIDNTNIAVYIINCKEQRVYSHRTVTAWNTQLQVAFGSHRRVTAWNAQIDKSHCRSSKCSDPNPVSNWYIIMAKIYRLCITVEEKVKRKGQENTAKWWICTYSTSSLIIYNQHAYTWEDNTGYRVIQGVRVSKIIYCACGEGVKGREPVCWMCWVHVWGGYKTGARAQHPGSWCSFHVSCCQDAPCQNVGFTPLQTVQHSQTPHPPVLDNMVVQHIYNLLIWL